jgi:Zn ribbon nucleic-acid-binding protein
MDARCPKCEKVAVLDDDIKNVKCPHCGFEETYDNYIEIMKESAINMATDYIPDRPGF